MRWVIALAAGCGFSPTVASDGASGGDVDASACGITCPLGCDPTATRCLELVPSNGVDGTWLVGGGPLDATIDLVIDTDAGTIGGAASPDYHQVAAADCGGGAQIGLGVFAFSSITIAPGVHVTVVGTRALALASAGPIAIDGIVDVTSNVACGDPPRCAGPGGFAGGLYDAYNPQVGYGPGGGGHGYSNDGPGNESGGGGGAGCGAGGTGGDDGSGLYPPGAGGTPFMTAALVPLCGGSGGGAGGPASFIGDPGSRGGGGGGAVQIVSAISVTIGGGIRAGGGGGQGDKAQTIDDGGGGGGAGGAILLEAPTIAIESSGVLAANGGGGAGGYNNGAIATDGEPGMLSALAAMGGPGVRRGGNGAAGDTTTGETAPGPVGDGGAGGGGGTGRIRINSRSGAAAIAGTVSPSLGACATQGTVSTR